MKKTKAILCVFLLCMPLMATAADVKINETNFPDKNFRNFLLEQDYGKDGVLTEEEIKWIYSIVVDDKGIGSLKGIEHFTALTLLSCRNNQLTALDMSKNTALTWLSCTNNQLTVLDISKNKDLTSLECNFNQLTALDVSENTALDNLSCINNQLTTLDVSKNKDLTFLQCGINQLTALDVSENAALTWLSCFNNQLTTLDVSKNKDLTSLQCGTNLLTALDVSDHTVLSGVECSSNQITALDVSGCTALEELLCYSNQIKGEAMDALINSLPEKRGENVLYVYNESTSDEGNIMTKSQVADVKAKGWTPYYVPNGTWQWLEYEGSDDESVGILPNTKIENTNTPVYNISGQRVTTMKKGLYIINGKKVVIK